MWFLLNKSPFLAPGARGTLFYPPCGMAPEKLIGFRSESMSRWFSSKTIKVPLSFVIVSLVLDSGATSVEGKWSAEVGETCIL